MFDPTSRIQSAQLHGVELHHSARHHTHHAADHAVLRRTARAAGPRRTPSIRRPALSLRSLGARYRVGRLTHRSA